jgi:hypothetical protein
MTDTPAHTDRDLLQELADSLAPRTRTGRTLTDADLDRLAAEAERGYDISQIRPRPRPAPRPRAQPHIAYDAPVTIDVGTGAACRDEIKLRLDSGAFVTITAAQARGLAAELEDAAMLADPR